MWSWVKNAVSNASTWVKNAVSTVSRVVDGVNNAINPPVEVSRVASWKSEYNAVTQRLEDTVR